MSVCLVLPQPLFEDLRSVAALPTETAGVLLTSVVSMPNGTLRLLGRGIRWVDDAAYIRRDWDRMTIRSEGYVNALGEAERLRAACIWVHTHPGHDAIPRASGHDRIVDGDLADLFRLRSGSPYYGALILSLRSSTVTFTGHLEREHSTGISIDRLWKIGERFQLLRAFDSSLPPLSSIFDRNVRAFGPAIQHTLSDLRIAIVGCGGTGSSVAEQLVRLGVRHLVLLDSDVISASNLTRVYGSAASDIGVPKVTMLARHLSTIAPDLRCETVQSMITLEPAARSLVGCDVVFGCTDDNAGRLVLSRLSSYFLTPVIDCGILLSSDESGQLMGIDGRVTVLSPGSACLVCRDRIDLSRAASELLTPAERIRREDEGYAPALGRTEPAVVPFTTAIAATAVGELLERLIGYGPSPRPNEVLLRCHEREISTNIAVPREGHYCHPLTGKLGAGIVEPFLEQTWPK